MLTSETLIQFLIFASNHGAFCFGGVVRDFVVPKLNNDPSIHHELFLIDLKKQKRDVDLFFCYATGRNEFIQAMGENFTQISTSDTPTQSLGFHDSLNTAYHCFRVAGVYKTEHADFKVDLIWGREFRGYDVDVSALTCHYKSDGSPVFSIRCIMCSILLTQRHLHTIKHRKCTVTREYWLLLKKEKKSNPLRFEKRIDRLVMKYLNSGWRVYVPVLQQKINLNKILDGHLLCLRYVRSIDNPVVMTALRFEIYKSIASTIKHHELIKKNLAAIFNQRPAFSLSPLLPCSSSETN